MQKLTIEVCDANGGTLCEPVFLEDLAELPMGIKQAVEDFIEAHEGEVATPFAIMARQEHDEITLCFSLPDEGARHCIYRLRAPGVRDRRPTLIDDIT